MGNGNSPFIYVGINCRLTQYSVSDCLWEDTLMLHTAFLHSFHTGGLRHTLHSFCRAYSTGFFIPPGNAALCFMIVIHQRIPAVFALPDAPPESLSCIMPQGHPIARRFSSALPERRRSNDPLGGSQGGLQILYKQIQIPPHSSIGTITKPASVFLDFEHVLFSKP